MLVRPMIGRWEPPRIERIRSSESRRLARFPVVGLSGDLHQDLGRGALSVEITGSLNTDEVLRDEFLKEIREQFLAGDPVDFVADIVKESELERVLIQELHFEEVAGVPDAFRYRIVLREYTEPPAPPSPLDDLAPDIGLDALSLLEGLDLPAIVADIPDMNELLSPVQTAAQDLQQQLSQVGTVLDPLKKLLQGG